MTSNQFVEPDKMGSKVADALESCNWANAPIGNKAILAQAVALLRADQNQGALLGYIWPEEIDGPNRCRVMTVSRPGDFLPNMIPVYQVPQLIHGEPVAWIFRELPDAPLQVTDRWDVAKHLPFDVTSVYPHADPVDVERLHEEVAEWKRNTQRNADTAMEYMRECESLKAELARARREPLAHQIKDYLATSAARQNLELATDREAYKSEVDRLLPEIDSLRAQLAERDALLRDIASDDLPGNVHPHYRQRASALLERNP